VVYMWDIKSLRCLLGFHDWCVLLPGQRKVTYMGKEWWTVGGIDFNYCQRCGKVAKGTLLLPAGWDGDPIFVGEKG